MNIIFSLWIMLSPNAFAQEAELAPPGLVSTLDELEQQKQLLFKELAVEFSRDPNFEVTQEQDHVVVKRRTPLTKNPDDPEELKKKENLQKNFSFRMGVGTAIASDSSYAGYLPANGKYELTGKHFAMEFEFGFRPPTKYLKRLFVGIGAGSGAKHLSPPTTDEIRDIPEGDRTHYLMNTTKNDFLWWWSTEWDVLYIPIAKTISALSAGYYSEKSGIYDGIVNTYNDPGNVYYPYSDNGVQARWRVLTGGFGSGSFFAPYVVGRMSKKGIRSLLVGVDVNFGNRLWVKKKTDK